MNTFGVLLLAAATATTGIFGKAHVGGKRFLRHHVEASGPAPPGGPIGPATGCQFGHPGCGGGPTCPGGGGGPGMAGMGGPGMGGPGGPGGASNRRFPNVRSQIFFVDPPGMRIGWQTTGGGVEKVYLPGQLTVPARYNFTQGYIYRLKLTDIPGRPGLTLYPTLEIAPSTPATDAFLTHNPIPAQFTDEDFDQVTAGNFVTKVIYLPDPKFQELAIQGVETLVSTRLEPGVDPILEADRRGTILMIVRLGAIDLEMPSAGVTTTIVQPGGAMMNGTMVAPAPAPAPAPGPEVAPNTLPPGAVPSTSPFRPAVPPPAQNVPLDTAPGAAPVTPAAPGEAVDPNALPPADPNATPPPPPANPDMPEPPVPAPGGAEPPVDAPRA